MTAPIVNIPLLRKAVEWVEAQAALPIEDREWDQMVYRTTGAQVQRSCGTVMCVAGYVADISGVEWAAPDDYMTIDGEAADTVAERLLGLPPDHRLFGGDNTVADVRRIAEGIAGERL